MMKSKKEKRETAVWIVKLLSKIAQIVHSFL